MGGSRPPISFLGARRWTPLPCVVYVMHCGQGLSRVLCIAPRVTCVPLTTDESDEAPWASSTPGSCRSRLSSRTARSCSTRTTRTAWSSIRAATSTDAGVLEGQCDHGSAIWITHGHIDHAGGAMELKEALGVEIIGPHEADRPLLANLENQARTLRSSPTPCAIAFPTGS